MIFSSFQFILVFLPVTLLIFHLFRFFISGKFALGFLHQTLQYELFRLKWARK